MILHFSILLRNFNHCPVDTQLYMMLANIKSELEGSLQLNYQSYSRGTGALGIRVRNGVYRLLLSAKLNREVMGLPILAAPKSVCLACFFACATQSRAATFSARSGPPVLLLLLPGHDLAHLGFGILEQLAADVHRHAVNCTGELERRGVLRCDRRTAITAALKRPTRYAKH